MRIVTLNTWGGRCGAALPRYLADVDCDVVCLQEVTRTADGRPAWLTYRDGDHVLSQRASLFDEIADMLPGHEGRFAAAARGTLEDGDGRPVVSDWGLACFVRRDLPVIAAREGFIHGDYAPDGWGEHPRARNAQGVRVFDRGTGRALSVVNLHGLRDPAGKGDTPARAGQARRLEAFIKNLAGKGDGVVVCGDFNLLPDSETFERLGRLGLVDLVVGNGHDDTRTSFYAKSPRFADYMLVNDRVGVAAFEVVAEPEVSDHRPLVLETAAIAQ